MKTAEHEIIEDSAIGALVFHAIRSDFCPRLRVPEVFMGFGHLTAFFQQRLWLPNPPGPLGLSATM